MDKDSQFFLKKDFTDYSGKWVAIRNQKIIASNRDIKNVVSTVKREPQGQKILFAKIPEKKQVLIL